MLTSFVVAVIAFWCPLNWLSLLLAFASIMVGTTNDWEECAMSKKLEMVSLGISGTERA